MHPLEAIEKIKEDPRYRDQILSVHCIPGRPGETGKLSVPLPDMLQKALERQGIQFLYRHQAEAVELARREKHFIVTTPTASGKSLTYNLPVFEKLVLFPEKRALYIYPTKALAHDQLGKMSSFQLPYRIGAYDGDTRAGSRASIRDNHIVLTNPDMLHLGILPYHLNWFKFFSNLAFVVIDEAHYYRGVLGIHMAHILRRLRRICDYYGSRPLFILSSATIENPCEHAEKLTGLPVEAITENSAPSGDKYIVFWNPYPPNKEKLTGRSRYLQDAVWLLKKLLALNFRSIVFTKSRQLTEWLWLYLDELSGGESAEKIKTYRGGYLPEQRREIEALLFGGALQGVISTNALELGVDIGTLDAGIIVGFPGGLSSFWQQAGRVGRKSGDSLVIYISTSDLLDLYYLHHAEDILAGKFGPLYLDIENPYILLDHILCAAFELPLSIQDAGYWGGLFEGLVSFLAEDGDLTHNPLTGQWYFNRQGYPAQDVNLRSASRERYLVMLEDGEVLETVEGGSAFSQLYPKAIYIHHGKIYEVKSLDPEKKIALLSSTEPGYFTESSERINVEIQNVHQEKEIFHGQLLLGEVEVISRVTGFRRRMAGGGRIVSQEELSLPEEKLPTVAFWLTIPDELCLALKERRLDLHGGMHGAEHALIGLMPLVVVCDRWDLAGTSMPFHPQTGKPSIFVYDAVRGGIGLAEKGWEKFHELVSYATDTVSQCPCVAGCPSCIQSPKCGNWNQPLEKEAAIAILKYFKDGKL